MARALLIVERRGDGLRCIEAGLDALNALLCPDNIEPRSPLVGRAPRATAVVFNPTPSVRIDGASIRLGLVAGEETDWTVPGSEPPDGSFALFRTGESRVELVADAAASRTIWYASTANTFLASTSQRAIVWLLGGFELNRDTIPWMMSTGTLGPAGGWDARLAALRPGERLMLDRRSWSLSSARVPVSFSPARGPSRRERREELERAVDDACRCLRLEPSRWLLPLSGGVDSRGLLCMLEPHYRVQTLTWGMSRAQHEAGNDASIAATVAEQHGVVNRYFATDSSEEPKERLLERFLCAGEGRAALLSGYLDGFRVWKTLHDEGWNGVIRGDEAFGSMYVRDEYEARHSANMTLLSDYFDADTIASFELAPQRVPDELVQQPGESLATWRDRIYQEFRLPYLLAALTDLKSPYVEVVNPLLTRGVLEVGRALPDDLRTHKRLWRELVRARSRPAAPPFARDAAVKPLEEYLREPAMLEIMLAELETPHAVDVLGPALAQKVCGDLERLLGGAIERRRRGLRSRVAAMLPEGARRSARRWAAVKPLLYPSVFAFRAFVAVGMSARLARDAQMSRSALAGAANL